MTKTNAGLVEYARLQLGKITIEQVPEKWRAAVQAALDTESEVTTQ